MEEQGIVIKAAGGRASVRIERSRACDGCHACLAAESGPSMIAEAADGIGVAPGDVVRIRTEAASGLAASLLLFGLPLLLLFAGYAAGSAVASGIGAKAAAQGVGIASAAAAFAGSFGLLALVARKLRKSGAQQSVVVEVLSHQS